MGRGSSIKVGEQAVLSLAGRSVTVKVVEDRGHLAPGKARLLRLGIVSEADDTEPQELELSESIFDDLLVNESAA